MAAEDLASIVAREAPLDPSRVADVVARLLDALRPLHDAEQAHGALRPSIVVVDRDGVVLGRWSSAHLGDDAPYLAPERTFAGAHADVRGDVWSVGAIAYELATGHPPFEGHGDDLVSAIRSAPVRPVRDVAPWVPPDLAFAIERALVKDPNGRWSSAEAFARALRATVLEGHVVVVLPPESRATAHARTSIAPLPATTEPMRTPPPIATEPHAAVTIPTPPLVHAHVRPGSFATRALAAVAIVAAVLVVGLVLRGPAPRAPAAIVPDEAPGGATPTPSFAPRPIAPPSAEEAAPTVAPSQNPIAVPTQKKKPAPPPTTTTKPTPPTVQLPPIVLPPIKLPPFFPLPSASAKKKPNIGGL